MRVPHACVLIGFAFTFRAAAVTNLLPDGGFEAGQWTLTTWDHGEAKHEFTAEARTGTKAVKLTGISGQKAAINVMCHSPAIDVTAEMEYVLSLWFRTSGTAAPFVSLLTYKQPWAAAQWKTPSTAYVSRYLPEAEHWTPWTWRFRTAPGSVQLIAAVRCSGVAIVWYDDIALFPVAAAKLKVLEPGTITTLPSQRRVRVEVSVGEDTPRWNAFLLDVGSGRQIAAQEHTMPQKTLDLTCTAADGSPLMVGLEDAVTGAVLATAQLTAPPLVNLAIISPRYRNSLYLSLKPKAVLARLSCTADGKVRKGMGYAVSVDNRPPKQWKAMASVNDLRIPLPDMPLGNLLIVTVHLKGAPGYDRLSATLEVIPPASAGREVLIGDHNETLVDGKPFFPAGFYGMPAGPQADPIPKAGYNAALTYDTGVASCKRWLDDCQRLGLLGMVSIPHPFVGRFDETRLREALRTVKHHQALLGYYLFDEPGVGKSGETPAELKRVYDVVADEDPYHPVGVCINVPEFTDDYADCYDVVMPDPYPLLKTLRPLTEVSERVEGTREMLADRKPVWVVPQAFGWDVIQGIDDPEQYRTPTAEQERCMTYLALVHGVRGVMYYCYHVYTRYDAEKKKAGGWPYVLGGYLPDQQPKLWAALAGLGSELKLLAAALTQPATQVGVTGSVHWRLSPGSKDAGGWLLAVNADETKAASVTIPLQGREAKAAKVLFGPGSATVAVKGVKVDLPPMGTVAAIVKAK